jgi:hypothetical protein
MRNILLSWRNISFLVTLTALISIFFVIRHYEGSLAAGHSTILFLQEQLLTEKNTSTELAESLAIARETRESTESELQEALVWENRYEGARTENESLQRKITEQQRQYEAEIARLERARKFLSGENNSKNESLARLSEINNELERNISDLKAETGQQEKVIARLEAENKQYEKEMAGLQKPVEAGPDPLQAPESTAAALSVNDDGERADTYRHVRIQSLINTMRNQDSGARKNILVNVIPTIPNGISGDEFLSLVNGMESQDILTALQLTSQYLQRPLDNTTVTALTGKMNTSDAEAAADIFKAKEQE